MLLLGCGSSDDGATTTNDSASSGGDGGGTAQSSSSGSDSSSSGGGGGTGGSDGSGGTATDDVDMTEADFECMLNWDLARKFRITNKLGHLDEALAVANSPDGGTYPVGTVISLLPTEVMVKRKAGFSPETNDWEFFVLTIDGKQTTISDRGTTEVTAAFGQTCISCHSQAKPQWDFICDADHGCPSIPLNADQIKQQQDSDSRCAP
ncbi:hypothetical protein [Sorangium sp. So ce1000]|uniref:hypothetical protein n=1 Tax=Sorangium sp. So ce1000 TaxID=3133325 RepID=UPI003F623BBD